MKKRTNHIAPPAVVKVDENVSLEEQIAQRAHEIWQQRAQCHGNDMDDWFQAEREISDWHQQRLAGKLPNQL